MFFKDYYFKQLKNKGTSRELKFKSKEAPGRNSSN